MKRLMILISLLGFNAYSQGPKITVTNTPGKMRMGQIEKHSLYDRAGLQSHDIVREIDGKKVDDNTLPSSLDTAIKMGKTVKVERKGQIKILKSKPMKDEPIQEIEMIETPAPDPN